MHARLSLVLCVLLVVQAAAGLPTFTFEQVANTGIPGLGWSSSAWSDINGDSYPDLLITGANETNAAKSYIVLNNRDGTFSIAPFSSQLGGVQEGCVGWGDYNNDGRQDFFLFGEFSIANAWIYRGETNSGTDPTFTLLPANQVPPSRWQCTANWVDFNNDNWADIFACGPWDCYLYRNDAGVFTAATPPAIANFQGSVLGGSDWADFNQDGHLDLFVTGEAVDSTAQAALFVWDIESELYFDSGLSFQGIVYGTTRFVDLNRDNYPDIVLIGVSDILSGTTHVAVHINNRDGGFNEIATTLPPLAYATIGVGDYNADGYPDLILCGAESNGVNPQCGIYRNNQNETFTNIGAGLVGMEWGSAHFVDYDNDGLLDVFTSGHDGATARLGTLYRNLGPTCVNGVVRIEGNQGYICSCYLGWTGDACDALECLMIKCLDTGNCVESLSECVTNPTPPQGDLVQQQIINSHVVLDPLVLTTVDLLSSADTSLRGQITIPAGVFGNNSTTTGILIVQSVPLSTITAANVDINNIFSVVIDLSFSGINVTAFAQPINITLQVSQLPPGTCLAYLQGNTWICEDFNPVLLPGGFASGLTTHFTSFGMLLDPNGGNNNGGDGDGFDNVLLAPIIVSVVVALFVVVAASVGILFFFWWRRRRMTRHLTQSSHTGFED